MHQLYLTILIVALVGQHHRVLGVHQLYLPLKINEHFNPTYGRVATSYYRPLFEQERALRCSGGLAWWNDLLVVPCVTAGGQSEVRSC